MSRFQPTDEQLVAIELFRTGDSLAIEAGAGTGKTSTLTLLGRDTRDRGQYVAFNKAIVIEAGQKMPGNVAAHTAHGLAFRAVGKDFAHRLNSPRMKSWDIAKHLGIEGIGLQYAGGRKYLDKNRLAGIVMRTLVSFCQSADEKPTKRHVPYIDGIDLPAEVGRRTFTNNNIVAEWIMPWVHKAWLDAKSEQGVLTYKHDYYLKLWQLEDPRINADFILFDEAQDANPVMVAIIEAQAGRSQIVWVGDSQQQIYSFTGAINALAKVQAANRTFLTQSFRFGHAIADVANSILGKLNAELVIRGYSMIDSKVQFIDHPNVFLTRTNAVAVGKLLTELEHERKVHIVGGGGDVISFARAADNLKQGRKTEHADLACFDSWTEVLEYVRDDEQGSDLKLFVDLVEQYGTEKIIAALDAMVPEDRAELVISTAHKSKGREWNLVQLANDFPDPNDEERPRPVSPEELRLLYVACTRAKFELDITAVPALEFETPVRDPLVDRYGRILDSVVSA